MTIAAWRGLTAVPSQKQARGDEALLLLSWTTSERADQPRADFCFPMAEQSFGEAAPVRLVLVRRGSEDLGQADASHQAEAAGRLACSPPLTPGDRLMHRARRLRRGRTRRLAAPFACARGVREDVSKASDRRCDGGRG